MNALEQFAENLAEGLKNRAKAEDYYNSNTLKQLIPVAKGIAAQLTKKEALVFSALLNSWHQTDVVADLEKLTEAVSEAGSRIS
jgi:hypothetical protein